MLNALLCRLEHSEAQGIPNLTAVNPYISSTLGGTAAAASGAVAMPRQRCCGVAPAMGMAAGGGADAGSSCAVGVSGFAFQGTNAHVVLGRCTSGMCAALLCSCIDCEAWYA
jgi:hypothetical protein